MAISNKTFPIKSAARKIYQKIRIIFYYSISDNSIFRKFTYIGQPVLSTGLGTIRLAKCQLGYWPSPHYFSGYIHIEARFKNSLIDISDGVVINNNATIVAEHSSIVIKANTLIGPEFSVYDSDFHNLNPSNRNSGSHECLPVLICQNVFIGSRVTILKGVTIGENSVIASNSVVVNDIPANCIAGGIPAKVISYI